jgi:hypothetical protein
LPGTSLTLVVECGTDRGVADHSPFLFIRVRPSFVATLTAPSVNAIAAAVTTPAVGPITPGLVPAGACGDAPASAQSTQLQPRQQQHEPWRRKAVGLFIRCNNLMEACCLAFDMSALNGVEE